jgi:hypothetical protein
VEDRPSEPGDGEEGFLPPEPPGPEPELDRPAQPGTAPGAAPPPPQGGPPNAGFPGVQQPPPQQPPTPQQPPPSGYAPPPPGWQPQPGQAWQPPPGQGWQPPPPPGWPQQPWGYAAAREPDNGPAVAGFVLSMVSVGLLVLSLGLSSIVSIVCAGLGIYFARQGKKRVDMGLTRKHRDLAQAGLVSGWIGMGLSILATLSWIAVIVVGITTDAFDDNSSGGSHHSDSISATLGLALAALRASSRLAF